MKSEPQSLAEAHRSNSDPFDIESRDTVISDLTPSIDSSIPDHQELIANYLGIIRNREITNPIRFSFIRELGKGRQGIVFLGLRHGGRTCTTLHAIKLHDPSIYSNAQNYWADMTRIASQISRLQPIHSDSLVSREAYDEYKGVAYIQMAAIDGVDLQYLLEGPHLAIARSQSTDRDWNHFMRRIFRIQNGRVMLHPDVALHILRKILKGLGVMHEAGYLHADVKPSNVMIDRMGSVKLVDFGRAVLINEPINILLGSPFYMAPETHRLESGLPQSDIYGTGLVGIELLGGQPFAECSSMTEQELLAYKMTLPSRLDSLLPSHVRQDNLLISVLKRFIDPDPAKRFTSADEASDSDHGLRGVHRQMGILSTEAEYDRELERYLEKISNPDSGHVNPRL